ncbi:hypothetical protein [Morganella sp. GD04133]|uniref:hypothetical protein n=1 Tax=Morganella sp. GD04133 TaxID=2975435 RepID=UPI00244C8C76|nr:hypothetical protein [Morganella sp. GD04133]MDH0357128.1 hypothetical protein [Morganella sp. GD04133]
MKSNYVGFVSIFTLLISFLGAVSLFVYCNEYGIPFYKMMQSQIFIAMGVLHTTVVVLSIFFILLSLFFIYKLHKWVLVIEPTIKVVFIETKILLPLMAIFPFLSLLIMIYKDYSIFLIFLFSILPIPFYCALVKKTAGKIKSFLIIYSFFLITPQIYVIACLFFSVLNVINLSSRLGIILSFFYYFFVVCSLKNQIKFDFIKSNIFLLSFVTVAVILIIIIVGRGADKVITKIGVGFEERCYLSENIRQYNIPEKYVFRKNDTILSLFVLSDISNEMYIGHKENEEINFGYSFKYKNLNQVSCNYQKL